MNNNKRTQQHQQHTTQSAQTATKKNNEDEQEDEEALYERMDFVLNLEHAEEHYDYPKKKVRPVSVDVSEINKERVDVANIPATNGGSHTLPKLSKNTYKPPQTPKLQRDNRIGDLLPVLPPRSSTFPRDKQTMDTCQITCQTTWYVPSSDGTYHVV